MPATASPAGLGRKGAAFWRKIMSDYELAPHEEMILEGACRELDLIAKLELAIKPAVLIVKGSMGQDVANPLLAEIRQHRMAFMSAIKQLRLPALEDKPAQSARSRSAQAAANARWARGS